MGNESSSSAAPAASTPRGPRRKPSAEQARQRYTDTLHAHPSTPRRSSAADLHALNRVCSPVERVRADERSSSAERRGGRASPVQHRLSTAAEPTLADTLKLTGHQCQLLVASCPKLQLVGHAGLAECFRSLEQKNDEVRRLFQKQAIVDGFGGGGGGGGGSTRRSADPRAEHARLLYELLSAAVGGLRSPARVTLDRCADVGAQHSALGALGGRAWDQLGECLADWLCRAGGKREAVRAWLALLSLVVDALRGGCQAEARRREVVPAHKRSVVSLPPPDFDNRY